MSRTGLGLTALVLALIILIAPWVIALIASSEPFAAKKTPELSGVQQKALETLVEMDRLLTTLSIAVFAGVSAYAGRKYNTKSPMPQPQILALTAACAFAASSIMSGYFAYDSIVSMLMKNFFYPEVPFVAWKLTAQFWLFLLSVLSVGIFAYREVT